MATARIPALRNLLGRRLPLRLPNQQRRWAQVHDVRFLATTQAGRNVVEKYREKLDRKAREEGHNDIGELKDAYRDRIQDLKKKDTVSIPGLDALLDDSPAPAAAQQAHTTEASDGLTQPPPPPPSSSPHTGPGQATSTIKPLSSILDLPKARALPEKELSAIWRLRHASSPTSLCAVIPTQTYTALEATARRHPTFVLPVPRGEGVGAEIHFLQWVFDAESRTATVLFTQLAEYKARGEWAQPHTSITHYWDAGLAEEPGVVLMAGSVVEGRGASVLDARWLVMLLQRFYGGEGAVDEGKRRLLEEFGRGDGGFSVERLLEESEKLG
ncbi:ATP11-domain-containing protein [Annulohypoxylon maeteangense]|uniref:ATP11-domain-containing protein n=1 Tax=Annulohypoxylon maeteangense TaxID=1927788 RepID=UPI0020077A51|nr:ATP11-domain-containing protein [Annulohypoxylon maeteangense]KAI0890062.1 ATP11-domain-containing protein [Annulohypoxylon maeteangense]